MCGSQIAQILVDKSPGDRPVKSIGSAMKRPKKQGNNTKVNILSESTFFPLGKYLDMENDRASSFADKGGYYQIIHPSAIDSATMQLDVFADVAVGDKLVLMCSTEEELSVSRGCRKIHKIL